MVGSYGELLVEGYGKLLVEEYEESEEEEYEDSEEEEYEESVVEVDGELVVGATVGLAVGLVLALAVGVILRLATGVFIATWVRCESRLAVNIPESQMTAGIAIMITERKSANFCTVLWLSCVSATDSLTVLLVNAEDFLSIASPLCQPIGLAGSIVGDTSVLSSKTALVNNKSIV